MDGFASFAKYLENRVVEVAKRIIEENGIVAEYASNNTTQNTRMISIVVCVDDALYQLPQIDMEVSFKYPNHEAELNDFYESSGKFIAYDFLLKNGIDLNEKQSNS